MSETELKSKIDYEMSKLYNNSIAQKGRASSLLLKEESNSFQNDLQKLYGINTDLKKNYGGNYGHKK